MALLEKLVPPNTSAVIFDFDGVLVDTESIGLETCESILKNYGVFLTQKEKLEYFQIPDSSFYEGVFRSRQKNVDAKTVLKEHQKRYNQLIQRVNTTLPGVREALEFFKKKQLPCALCSGSPRILIDQILLNTSLQSTFDVIVAREDFVDDKPSVEPYTIILGKLGLPPKNCVTFEDTRRGVESAKKAGIYTIGVLIGNHGSDQLEKADQKIYSFKDALE